MTLLVILLFIALLTTNIVGAVAYTHAQVWRERAEQYQAQLARLSERLSESEAAYQSLQHSLQTGGWVRLSSDEELEGVKGGRSWN